MTLLNSDCFARTGSRGVRGRWYFRYGVRPGKADMFSRKEVDLQARKITVLVLGWVEDSVVRSDSQGFGVAGSFSQCAFASFLAPVTAAQARSTAFIGHVRFRVRAQLVGAPVCPRSNGGCIIGSMAIAICNKSGRSKRAPC